MQVMHLTDTNFDQEVLNSEGLVLVDFWAARCAPCKAIFPVLDELAKEYNSRIKIYKINIDENKTMATKYQILSIPTLLFLKNGKVVSQIAWARTASDIKKIINSLIS